MSHRILAVAATAVTALAVATPAATANYLMPKSQATSFARSDVTARYVDLKFGDDSNVQLSCRPSRNHKLNPSRGRSYHRWVCGWKSITLTDRSCSGRVLIVGSAADRNNTYYRATLEGARCTDPQG